LTRTGDVPGLPAAPIFGANTADQDGSYLTIIPFSKGSYFVEILDWRNTTSGMGSVQQLAVAEYDRLP
jgi:hypothetical protein